MKRTIGACMILAVLCVAGLTGCGGSTEDPAAAAGDATPEADGATDDAYGDFVARAEALCRLLAVRFATDLRTALSDSDHLAEAADTTDPGALAPSFAAAEAGFGRAVDLTDLVQAELRHTGGHGCARGGGSRPRARRPLARHPPFDARRRA